YVTAAGSNKDFVTVARVDNTSPLTIRAVDPSANSQPLTVTISTNAITVNLATGPTGTLISTAADVVAALNGYTAGYNASGKPFLNPSSGPGTVRGRVYAQLAPGQNGSGVVAAFGAQGLGAWG